MRERESDKRKFGFLKRGTLAATLFSDKQLEPECLEVISLLLSASGNDIGLDQFPELQACLSNNKDPQRCSDSCAIVIIAGLHNGGITGWRKSSSSYSWW